MNRLYPILFTVALLPCAAEAQEPTTEISGAANLEFCEKMVQNEAVNWREGYCFGVINAAMSIMGVYGMICLPPSSSLGQGVRVVVAFMERHPELLHKPMTALAIDAFNEAFPCHHR